MAKLLIIVGPTATGKTKFAVQLARQFNGEIISADSRQVYKGLDTITGKDKQEYGKIPVWGIDLVEPEYRFNASDFVNYATTKISEIQKRGRLPIVVGGTILYIKSLLDPPETLNIPPDPLLRSRKFTIRELQNILGENDLNESDFKNPRRLIRAIETKGKKARVEKVNYDYEIISLVAPLEFIYQKIDDRVDKRIKGGAGDEARKFPNSTAIGIQEVGNPDLWKLKERQYAKRQITFIKKFISKEVNKGTKVIELDVSNETQKNSFGF